VLEAELVTVNAAEGAAFGTALLAGVGAGAWPNVPAACSATVKVGDTTRPDAAQAETYRRSYALYRELYPALKTSFGKMGAVA
jgi:xylulokinase